MISALINPMLKHWAIVAHPSGIRDNEPLRNLSTRRAGRDVFGLRLRFCPEKFSAEHQQKHREQAHGQHWREDRDNGGDRRSSQFRRGD